MTLPVSLLLARSMPLVAVPPGPTSATKGGVMGVLDDWFPLFTTFQLSQITFTAAPPAL